MNRIYLNKVLYKDKTYYCISCAESVQRKYLQYTREIGDEAFIIDNELFIDEGAFFNISMMDAESTFIIQ